MPAAVTVAGGPTNKSACPTSSDSSDGETAAAPPSMPMFPWHWNPGWHMQAAQMQAAQMQTAQLQAAQMQALAAVQAQQLQAAAAMQAATLPMMPQYPLHHDIAEGGRREGKANKLKDVVDAIFQLDASVARQISEPQVPTQAARPPPEDSDDDLPPRSAPHGGKRKFVRVVKVARRRISPGRDQQASRCNSQCRDQQASRCNSQGRNQEDPGSDRRRLDRSRSYHPGEHPALRPGCNSAALSPTPDRRREPRSPSRRREPSRRAPRRNKDVRRTGCNSSGRQARLDEEAAHKERKRRLLQDELPPWHKFEARYGQ